MESRAHRTSGLNSSALFLTAGRPLSGGLAAFTSVNSSEVSQLKCVPPDGVGRPARPSCFASLQCAYPQEEHGHPDPLAGDAWTSALGSCGVRRAGMRPTRTAYGTPVLTSRAEYLGYRDHTRRASDLRVRSRPPLYRRPAELQGRYQWLDVGRFVGHAYSNQSGDRPRGRADANDECSVLQKGPQLVFLSQPCRA